VNNELLINAASIAENIIIERLSDGSYQDYGGNLGPETWECTGAAALHVLHR
jgi:hypothetical protein